MDSNSHEFWKEISYLVSLLIATALSILSFRRANIDERVKETIKKFRSVNDKQNKIFHRLATNSRSREIPISSIISERIFGARKCLTEKIGKDESKTLQAITRISRKSIETHVVVSFVLFLGILLLYFSQNWLDKCSLTYIFTFCLCIFYFLLRVWLWKINLLLVIMFTPILILLLLPVYDGDTVIKNFGLILGWLLFLFCYGFELLGNCRKPELNSMDYIHENMKWCNKIGLISYLFFICFMHNIGTSIQSILCIRNGEIKKLLFKLAPLDIFIYFVINIAISYFLFVKQLERNLKRVFRYLVLKEFQPKSEKGHEEYLVDLAKQKEDYLNRLQIIAASDLDGLLLRKIQVDYEDKEY